MAEEMSCDLSDGDIQSASASPRAMWVISSLVQSTCSLSHLEENNLEKAGTNRFNKILAENDLLYEKQTTYISGQIQNRSMSRNTNRAAHPITLPRFPLKSRWSELALPTLFTPSQQMQGNKGQEVNEKSL